MKAPRLLLAAVTVWLMAAGLAQAERLAVKAPKANVRVGPGTEHAVVWQAERYYPVKVIERKGPWCRFEDFEGDRGWLHQSLLDKQETGVTKKNDSNLRAGPGTDHPVVMVVHAGVPFKVLRREGQWLRVEHADGETGWLAGSLVW
ncbi:MAG: SH3 domain-containing protein [Desulfobacteraceae bacterium]|nr:SH3 domain-containing protein [Desulfobacteraceae bacterium]